MGKVFTKEMLDEKQRLSNEIFRMEEFIRVLEMPTAVTLKEGEVPTTTSNPIRIAQLYSPETMHIEVPYSVSYLLLPDRTEIISRSKSVLEKLKNEFEEI